jgi:hypothetical protein
MENNKSIEQVLDSMENSEIYKSKPSTVSSILIFAAGIVLIAVNGIIPGMNSMIPTLFILAGAGFLIWGIVYAFFRKTGYRLIRTKENITVRELYFDAKERNRLLGIINSGNVQDLEMLKKADIDALKLRVAATQDGNFCYSQVVAYVPYEFVNANEPYRHSPEEAQMLLTMLKKQK